MCESYVLCFQVHRKNMNDWWNPLKTKPFQSFESFAHGRLARADCRVLHSLWLAKFVSWWCTYCCITASARYTQMCTLTVHIVFVCNESVQICVYCRTRHCMDKCLADVHFCTLYGLLTRNIITSVVFITFISPRQLSKYNRCTLCHFSPNVSQISPKVKKYSYDIPNISPRWTSRYPEDIPRYPQDNI